MATTDILSGEGMNKVGSTLTSLGSTGMFLLVLFSIGFLITLIAGGIFWYYMAVKRYKFKIEIRDDNDDVIMVRKARAITVRRSEGITSLLYIKKLKKYIKFPPRDFVKNNTIKMYYRPDGELSAIKTPKITIIDVLFKKKREIKNQKLIEHAEAVNDILMPIVSENIKQKMALAEVVWVDEDMRLSHVSTGKIIKDMFNFYSFLKEHGHTMLLIIGVLVMGVVVVMVTSSLMDFYKENAKLGQSTSELADRIDEINKNSVEIIMRLNDLNNNMNNLPSNTQVISEDNKPQEEYMLLNG